MRITTSLKAGNGNQVQPVTPPPSEIVGAIDPNG